MDDKAFSSIDIVGQCLVDTKRTEAFQKAIFSVVKKGDTVLDLGTGSAILALFAAQAGAQKVSAVEFDSFVAAVAKKNCEQNSFGSVVDIVVHDARTVSFDNKFDVVLCEMLTTGVVDEFQVQAINNLYDKNLVTPNTQFIPKRHDTFVTLVSSNTTFFGVKTSMIVHLWKWHNWRSFNMKNMSETVLVNSLDFKSVFPEKFSKTLELPIRKSGTINGICLTSISTLTDKIILKDTDALNAPVFVPLSERKVQKGEKIKLCFSYTFGGGFQNLKAEIV